MVPHARMRKITKLISRIVNNWYSVSDRQEHECLPETEMSLEFMNNQFQLTQNNHIHIFGYCKWPRRFRLLLSAICWMINFLGRARPSTFRGTPSAPTPIRCRPMHSLSMETAYWTSGLHCLISYLFKHSLYHYQHTIRPAPEDPWVQV